MIRAALVTLVACGVAFAAGRAIPRPPQASGGSSSRATSDNATAGAVAGEIAPRVRQAAPTRQPVPRRPVVLAPSPAEATTTVMAGMALPSEWVAAVRRSPEAAERVRAEVLETVVARGDAATIYQCLDDAGVQGDIRLRFAVAVTSNTTSLQVGDATFVEVADGPAITDASARCIEAELAGSDQRVGEGFLDDYTGRVAYTGQFRLTSD